MVALEAEILDVGDTGFTDPSQFNPRNTASAAWSRLHCSAVRRNTPSSERSTPRASETWTLGATDVLGGVPPDTSVDDTHTPDQAFQVLDYALDRALS